MEVKDIINEGRPFEPICISDSRETRYKVRTWYKIGVHDGYEYALEEFENNRLKACDNQTPEEAERETAFVVPFVKEHHRTPTFSDAIEVTRKQMIEKACKWLKENADDYGDYDLSLYFDTEQMIKGFRKAMQNG